MNLKKCAERSFNGLGIPGFILTIPAFFPWYCLAFHNWVSYSYILFYTAAVLFSSALIYFRKEENQRWEKYLFAFYSFCSFFILVYYCFFSGYSIWDNIVFWGGLSLGMIAMLLTFVLGTIRLHKQKKYSTSNPTSIYKIKHPSEWFAMGLLITSIVTIFFIPNLQ